MEIGILLLISGIMLAIGVPIGISLGIGMLSSIYLFDITTIKFVAQSLYSGLDSLPLLAIPCFMLAGSIMETGGLSKRLVNLADKLVGNQTGGLGTVVIIACMFFGAISGSAPATVGAISAIMIPYMVKAGYDKTYSTGLIASAGGLGVIVPPSIPLIVYGVTTNTSIGKLFIGGFGPAIVVGILLVIVSYFRSKKRGYKGSEIKITVKEILHAALDAKWALLMPIIILGGIYGGIFTPTEAAVVAIVYGIIIGLFVHKELNMRDLIVMINKNTSFVGGIMLTFAPAGALGAVLALLGVADKLQAFLLGVSDNLIIILLIINLFVLCAGMLIDTISAIIIFAPILYKVLIPLGIDPIHLGLILTINLAVGFVTPPVAANLFVASSITGIPMDKIVKSAWPFILTLIGALFITTYFPVVSLGLINLFY